MCKDTGPMQLRDFASRSIGAGIINFFKDLEIFFFVRQVDTVYDNSGGSFNRYYDEVFIKC